MSDERVQYSDSDSLISTTTPSSHITSCNEDFCQVSGYEEEELLDHPHNVIRHSDMPKEAFAQLWQYLQAGNSWMGLVKNRCKGSGHYWVSAFVTPIKGADGSIHEYQSVRTKPTDEQINRATALYKKMKSGTVTVRRKNWLTWTMILVGVQMAAMALLLTNIISNQVGFSLLSLAFVGQLFTLFNLHSRFKAVQSIASEGYDNPLMEYPYTGYCDDVSSIELALIMKKAELRAVTARAHDTTSYLLTSAEDESASSKSIERELAEQYHATEAIAESSDQMLQAIDEVAEQARQSSEFASKARQMGISGVETINDAVKTVEDLSAELSESQQALEQLYADVGGIEAILGMIQGIAEQTNLLALNAAIEAARAGETGRGFAVVADEVRALSEKTSSSVGDIRDKIEVLQTTVNSTGNLMKSAQEASGSSVLKSQEGKAVCEAIVDDLKKMGEQSNETYKAISDQVQVTQGMVDHVHRMKTALDATQSLSESSVSRTDGLVSRLESLQRLVVGFK
ncbi:methyl-accepting chemotaxis protein [Vibrio sp. RC27]